MWEGGLEKHIGHGDMNQKMGKERQEQLVQEAQENSDRGEGPREEQGWRRQKATGKGNDVKRTWDPGWERTEC